MIQFLKQSEEAVVTGGVVHELVAGDLKCYGRVQSFEGISKKENQLTIK